MRELDLDALTDLPPAARGRELERELLQVRLRSADDIAPASLAQPGEVVLACHPTIGDPHAPEHPVPVLHGRYDSLQGARVIGIAREYFVAERKPIEGHDERDQDLFAVGAVIPRIPALSKRIGFGLTFKVGARDVVEEHIVLDREQLA